MQYHSEKSRNWSISWYYVKVDMCAATSIPTFPPTLPSKITAEPVATVSCGKRVNHFLVMWNDETCMGFSTNRFRGTVSDRP